MKQLLMKLNELAALPNDWDTYGASRITQKAIDAATIFLNVLYIDDGFRPQIVPTSRGGLQFEWHQNGYDIEIEFDADGVIVCGTVEKVKKKEKK